MITHVAEASELSGRVVLWLDPEARCTPAVLDAPLRLAAAYDAEVETIVVDGSEGSVTSMFVDQIGRDASAW